MAEERYIKPNTPLSDFNIRIKVNNRTDLVFGPVKRKPSYLKYGILEVDPVEVKAQTMDVHVVTVYLEAHRTKGIFGLMAFDGADKNGVIVGRMICCFQVPNTDAEDNEIRVSMPVLAAKEVVMIVSSLAKMGGN